MHDVTLLGNLACYLSILEFVPLLSRRKSTVTRARTNSSKACDLNKDEQSYSIWDQKTLHNAIGSGSI